MLMFVGRLKEMGSRGVTTENVFERKVFSWRILDHLVQTTSLYCYSIFMLSRHASKEMYRIYYYEVTNAQSQ